MTIFSDNPHDRRIERFMTAIPNFKPRGVGVRFSESQVFITITAATPTEILAETMRQIRCPPFRKRFNEYKLAMWRLRSHEQFGGTWLSDYVPNRLGCFVSEHEPDKIKPDCKLIGENGNIFNLMGLAARTLRHNGLAEQATEMTDRIHECGSYDEALCIIGEYVNITGSDESEDEDEGMGMSL